MVHAHPQNRQRGGLLPAPCTQLFHRVVGAGVVDNDQLILRKVGIQLDGRRAAEFHRPRAVVVQVDNSGDKVFLFYIHTSSTSSRSYTVLILPLSTLTSFGSSHSTRTTVGRESSISLAFKIGFMLNRLLW